MEGLMLSDISRVLMECIGVRSNPRNTFPAQHTYSLHSVHFFLGGYEETSHRRSLTARVRAQRQWILTVQQRIDERHCSGSVRRTDSRRHDYIDEQWNRH